MSTVINATNIFSGDICARCGAHMQATHHRLCQERDGTPTALSDREVRKRLGLTLLDATTGEVTTNDMATKDELLKHYADKTSKAFYQFDGWLAGDCVVGCDDNGHGMTAGVTWELMRGGDVRVLIPLKTSSADAIALLRKIISWIEQSGGKEKIVPAAPRAADSAHSKED